MTSFKASRIKLDGITYDLDKPIYNKVEFEMTRRLPADRAIEKLINGGYLKLDKELKRQKVREDALIRTLKKIGGIFVP